jgi:hypothetical protein
LIQKLLHCYFDLQALQQLQHQWPALKDKLDAQSSSAEAIPLDLLFDILQHRHVSARILLDEHSCNLDFAKAEAGMLESLLNLVSCRCWCYCLKRSCPSMCC